MSTEIQKQLTIPRFEISWIDVPAPSLDEYVAWQQQGAEDFINRLYAESLRIIDSEFDRLNSRLREVQEKIGLDALRLTDPLEYMYRIAAKRQEEMRGGGSFPYPGHMG